MMLYICIIILKQYIMCKENQCYLCKETESQVTDLFVEGNKYVCDNCLINR